MRIGAGRCLKGRFEVPGDKSVAHRLALLSGIAEGITEVRGFPPGADCARSLDVIRALGVAAELDGDHLKVKGRGSRGLRPASGALDAGNSGTTARLSCGLLAGQAFDTRLTGDESLKTRPFDRVERPLTRMGARLETNAGRLPITIHGGRALLGLTYELPVPSAQVKSAVLFAGLYASGSTAVREPLPTRDHTEIALRGFGVDVRRAGVDVAVSGGSRLEGTRFEVPGDFSSAAFFIAAASCLPRSELIVTKLGLNPTRTALLDILRDMGASIEIEHGPTQPGHEPVGTVRVKGAELVGIDIPPDKLPAMIDEIPALAVVATQASGVTRVRGASELRVKESDRLKAITDGLSALGADVESFDDGFAIRGSRVLRPASLASRGDHRMVMAWAIASLLVDGDCTIDHRDQVNISYPGFWDTLERLAQ